MSNKADDLRLWRSFLILSDRGSLSAVAEAEGVEISTVSRAISQLEKAVGHRLVKRTQRPAELTDLGRSVLPRVRQIVELQNALLDELKDDSEAVTGAVRLSVSPGFAATKLTLILDEFNQLYPQVSFRITPGMSVENLVKGACDITVKTGGVASHDVMTFYRGHNFYLPVASPAYLKTHPTPKRPEDLAQHTVYLYNGPIREETQFLGKGDVIEPVVSRNSIHIPSIQAVRNAVLAGLGVAIDLTLNKCSDDILHGDLVPILPGWFRTPLPVYTVVSRSSWMLKRVRLFAKWFNDRMLQETKKQNAAVRQCYREKYGIALPEISLAGQ